MSATDELHGFFPANDTWREEMKTWEVMVAEENKVKTIISSVSDRGIILKYISSDYIAWRKSLLTKKILKLLKSLICFKILFLYLHVIFTKSFNCHSD